MLELMAKDLSGSTIRELQHNILPVNDSSGSAKLR